MKTLLAAALLSLSATALAAPPPGPGPRGPPPAVRGEGREEGEGRQAHFARRAHMAAVVGIAEALELNEAEALRLGEKLKGFEERRRPLREQMHAAMKTVKAAADGEAAALGQVDTAVQQVLDGRAQMAALDKELFNTLAQGQTPQKKAKLALFLAHFRREMGERLGGKGRR